MVFSLIASTILKNKWVYIIIAFLGIGYFAWGQYNEIQQLLFDRVVLVQNTQAYQDSLTKARDSVQTTALFVKSLNEDIDKLNHKYVILSNKYNLLVLAIQDSGNVRPIVTDSTVIVKFSGKKYIVFYSGRTEYRFDTDSATWNLDLDFDSINAGSKVYYDDSTKLWTIQTTSLTEGVVLKGTSIIDEATLKQIKGIAQLEEKGKSIFAIGGIISHDRIYAGITLKPIKNWMFNLNYKLFTNENVPNESLQNQLSFGIFYYLW